MLILDDEGIDEEVTSENLSEGQLWKKTIPQEIKRVLYNRVVIQPLVCGSIKFSGEKKTC